MFRISVTPSGEVTSTCLGLEIVDYPLAEHYDDIDALPNWVRERLAVLMIMSPVPPTTEVAGVGRRISARVFWVYPPEDPPSTAPC